MKFTLEIRIFCKRSLALMGHHSPVISGINNHYRYNNADILNVLISSSSHKNIDTKVFFAFNTGCFLRYISVYEVFVYKANYILRKTQTSMGKNLRILRIKNAKFSGYCFYMNPNIQWNFQICINVTLNLIIKILIVVFFLCFPFHGWSFCNFPWLFMGKASSLLSQSENSWRANNRFSCSVMYCFTCMQLQNLKKSTAKFEMAANDV